MRRRSHFASPVVASLAVALVMALLAAVMVPSANAWGGKRCNEETGVYPPECERIYGKLAARWWIWAFNCPPPPDNPIFDPDGSAAGVEQSGPIWYLAGTFGEAAERTCTVPAGKLLYIPLVNHMSFATEPGETEEMIRQIVTDGLDEVTELHCIIDGEPVEDLFAYRAVSKAFDFPSTEGSLLNLAFGLPVGTYAPAVAGAYAVLLDPLPPGPHVIEFGGFKEGDPDDPDDDWSLSLVYYITVE